MEKFENAFSLEVERRLGTTDPAHDIAHVKRVVAVAKKLCAEEKAISEIVIPAAWLHDFVNLPKNHSQRALASQMAALESIIFLKSLNYPKKFHDGIHHAICAHSFSAGIQPETIEAKIVQDADRLDALGAIGLARLFAVGTQMGRPFYDTQDPFATNRELNDKVNTIDHIYIKLKKISESMNTASAKIEARLRFNYIENFIKELKREIE